MELGRYQIDQEPGGLRLSMRRSSRGFAFSLVGLGLAGATHLFATDATWMVIVFITFAVLGLLAAMHRRDVLFTPSSLAYSSTFDGEETISRESFYAFKVHDLSGGRTTSWWGVDLTGQKDPLPTFEFDSKTQAQHFAETVARPWQLPIIYD